MAIGDISPQITEIYDVPIPGKMRAVVIKQAQGGALQLSLLDINGNPVDLTSCAITPTLGDGNDVEFRWREATELDMTTVSAQGTVVSTTGGIVKATIPDAVNSSPGVYICEVGVLVAGKLVFSNTLYTIVERGLFVGASPVSGLAGPPTIAEIRLSLRDSPEGNRLTDEYEFDASEAGDAMVRSVAYWNQSPPPVNQVFTTISFPFRYYWMEGIAAHLLETAANYYRRVHLPYQGGGISVDDLNKVVEYERAAEKRYRAWTDWVRYSKVNINISAGWTTHGSPYAGASGWDSWAG